MTKLSIEFNSYVILYVYSLFIAVAVPIVHLVHDSYGLNVQVSFSSMLNLIKFTICSDYHLIIYMNCIPCIVYGQYIYKEDNVVK